MTTDTAVNGVDLAAVGALVGRIQQEPEAAATVWSAEVAWKGAFQSEAYIRDFAPIPSDEPTGLGGADTGYEAINVSVALDTDASAEQVARLHDRVVGTSPVGHTLSRAVPVRIELAG